MRDVVSSGRLTVSDDAARAVQDTDVSFVCVGTPSRVNGEQDQTAVLRVAEQIGMGLRDHDRFHVVVVRSTVRLGSVDGQLREILESSVWAAIATSTSGCASSRSFCAKEPRFVTTTTRRSR